MKNQPDIYCIGFQEIVPLTTENVLLSADERNSRLWERHIQKVISPPGASDPYVLVKSRQLVGVLLLVFVRKRHIHHVRDMASALVKLGYGGYTANKGAVGLRFRVYNTFLCFVCGHLAAGQSNVEQRNKDWRDVLQNMNFGSSRRNRYILDHEIAFFFGDFNYRVSLTRAEVEVSLQTKR